MAMSDEDKNRTLQLARVEALQTAGIAAISNGGDVNSIADDLFDISQQTSDAFVSEMAMQAHAGISSAQIAVAAAALASVNDQIATATNTFQLAARIAQEGEENLTFPFIAGKAALLLNLVETLDETLKQTISTVGNIDGVDDLQGALTDSQASIKSLLEKAKALAA